MVDQESVGPLDSNRTETINSNRRHQSYQIPEQSGFVSLIKEQEEGKHELSSGTSYSMGIFD